MLSKNIKWLLKCVLSGAIALMIFCVISLFYYNTGRHTDNPSGATDFLWEGNKFYCQMREGFGFGVTDKDGFNNSYPGVTSNADVLVMGSSHMEAVQVKSDENTVYLLNELLTEASSGLTAYNIGLSSHDFFRCADNIEDAIKTYLPKYLVIEIYTIPVEQALLREVYENRAQKVVSHDGFLYDIQAIPLPKLLIQQYREYQNGKIGQYSQGFAKLKDILSSCSQNAQPGLPVRSRAADSRDYLAALLEKIGGLSEEYDVRVIFVFHPTLSLQKDGSAVPNLSKSSTEIFAGLCQSNGISFINMSDTFLEYYEENSILPHGFYNSAVGAGHLNAHGHRMIAVELFEEIINMQGDMQ